MIKNLKTTSFRVGDYIKCRLSFHKYPQKGWLGKILGISEEKQIIMVEWEQPFQRGFGEHKNHRNYSTENPEVNWVEITESVYCLEKTMETRKTFFRL